MLLRCKSIMSPDGSSPGLELLDILLMAYPECVSEDFVNEYGEYDPKIDYRRLVMKIGHDFIPAFKDGGEPGRPNSNHLGLVEAVDNLIAERKAAGYVISIQAACDILSRARFPGANRQAYYRERIKLSFK